jgi:hypothetical protein
MGRSVEASPNLSLLSMSWIGPGLSVRRSGFIFYFAGMFHIALFYVVVVFLSNILLTHLYIAIWCKQVRLSASNRDLVQMTDAQ